MYIFSMLNLCEVVGFLGGRVGYMAMVITVMFVSFCFSSPFDVNKNNTEEPCLGLLCFDEKLCAKGD